MRFPTLMACIVLGIFSGCGSAPSLVRDTASEEEELYLQQVQQTVEAEEREHQQKIIARRNGA
jgi:hypothetical protein